MGALGVADDGSIDKRPDEAAVAGAFEQWMREDRGAPEARVGACQVLRGGLETWSYDTRVERGPWTGVDRVVLRLHRWADTAQQVEVERRALEWAEITGIHAPTFVDAATTTATPLRHPFIVESYVSGAKGGQVWFIRRRRRDRTFPQLAEMHAQLHAAPTAGVDLAELRIDTALDELDQLELELGVEDQGALAWMRQHSFVAADDEARSMLHLDFHPGNVLDDGHRPAVIDWSQARLGDPHADVARTLEVLGLGALIVGLPPLVKGVTAPTVSGYLRAYEQHHELDEQRLRYWRAYHALVVRSQLRGIADRLQRRGNGGHVLARRGAKVMLWRWTQLALSDRPPF